MHSLQNSFIIATRFASVIEPNTARPVSQAQRANFIMGIFDGFKKKQNAVNEQAVQEHALRVCRLAVEA
jgi:hypothetical protein